MKTMGTKVTLNIGIFILLKKTNIRGTGKSASTALTALELSISKSVELTASSKEVVARGAELSY